MRRTLNSLIGHPIQATDGEVGRVDDLLFDDKTWGIAYLVARVGGVLSGKRVLIPPTALGRPDKRYLPVAYSRLQVAHCPGIDVDLPVTSTTFRNPLDLSLDFQRFTFTGVAADVDRSEVDPHLFSMRDVIGYSLHTCDHVTGLVKDFLIDQTLWSIVGLIAYLQGFVIVAPEFLMNIMWKERTVMTPLSQETLVTEHQCITHLVASGTSMTSIGTTVG